MLPSNIYMGKMTDRLGPNGKIECNKDLYIGINGFMRDSGLPLCITKFAFSGMPGSFPINVTYSQPPPEQNRGGSLEILLNSFRTIVPKRPRYYVKHIDLALKDPRTSGSYEAVFLYKKNASFYTGGANSLVGGAGATIKACCPTKYYDRKTSSGFCTLTSDSHNGNVWVPPGPCPVSSPPGSCPPGTWVPTPPQNAPGPLTEATAGLCVTCTAPPTPSPDANGGYYDNIKVTINPSANDCELNVPETYTESP